MRNIYIVISVSVISFLTYSCSSTNSLTISVTEPPLVSIPENINTVGIVTRNSTPEDVKVADDIDKFLSLEGDNLDDDAASTTAVGLFDELKNSNFFSDVKLLDSVNVDSPGLGILPSALSWQNVESICNDNGVDAIFVLSFFDTDASVDYAAVPVEINAPMGLKIPAIEHHATISTMIKTGFRIYDPINKMIPDEYLVNKNVVVSGSGINPVKAAEAISGRKEAVLEASNAIGHNYVMRIYPNRLRVSRKYYVKGTNNFKIAKRRAQTGDWDGAAELWHKEIANSKRKIAGRASYNMAIINEINGDLDAAIDWASTAYVDYKNKHALEYINILKYRIEISE